MAVPVPNVIDRLVGYLSPGRGIKRLLERQALTRAYEGASQRDGWRPRRSGASANTDHAADAASLRARSRSLVQNVPYIRRGLDSLVANIIGTGITPRSLSPSAAQIDKLWNEWAQVADADGRLDLYGLQAAAHRAMEQDGEVLIRLRPRRAEDGLPVPLQLQLLEIDWIDNSKNGGHNANTIVNGIEYSPLGRIVAYWLWDQHPGELTQARRSRSSSYPVPAERIVHLFNPERPGQGRGFPRLAPVIARVRDLQLYEDAELQRKNMEARLSVLASGDASSMSMTESQDQNTVRATGELGSLSSGSVVQVPSGLNLTVVEPKVAPGYVEYLKFNLHLVAAGMGVTYEMLTGDVSDTSFSSARVGLLEFRRGAEQLQWLTIIPRLCAPVWRAFIDAAVLGGALRTADYAVDWSTPKWDYVNPEQDVKADLAEISGGLASFSEKLRRRGYKPDLVFTELKADLDRLRADGTLDVLLQLQTGKTAAAAAAPASAARDSADLVLRGVEVGQRSVPQPAPAPPAPAPVIHNHLNVPEQRHEIHNHVAPSTATVEVRNDVNVPEAQVVNHVHVPEQRAAEAPTVNVQVDVAPAGVTVVDNHPTRAVQTVERDKDDEIVRTVTTFERE
jgi:lambda family phage portal protein